MNEIIRELLLFFVCLPYFSTLPINLIIIYFLVERLFSCPLIFLFSYVAMLFSGTYFSFSVLEIQICHNRINILSFDGLNIYLVIRAMPTSKPCLAAEGVPEIQAVQIPLIFFR